MHVAGSRQRSQPAPPYVVFEVLTDPDRDPARIWLTLLGNEQAPRIIGAEKPSWLVWSSLWPKWPDAQVRFDLASDDTAGTLLRWTLLMEQVPDPSELGHLRKRLNVLINANLRYTFGQ